MSRSRISTRNQLDCSDCDCRFSVTAGTIFHDSHLPLTKWFLAAFMMMEAKKGISAKQMERSLGIAYRTAWVLCHRIRAAMADAYPVKLKGIVKIYETFVGGEVRGKGRGYKGNKAVAVGAVQRGGRIILQVVPDRGRATLHNFVDEAVHDDAEAIQTYRGIGDEDTRHETVNYSFGVKYDRGDVHTNPIENIWSLLIRSIKGSYYKVSVKHLDAYLDELEWRLNNRENPWLFRDTLIRLLDSKNLEYKRIVS